MQNQSDAIHILWEDDRLIAFSKPSGLLVHRSAISSDRKVMVSYLQDMLGYKPFPVHRLDRPTSGLILFAKDKDAASAMAGQFKERDVKKIYLAVVRGWVNQEGKVDRPVKTPSDYGPVKVAEALTYYKPLLRTEIPISAGRYPTSRFSLLQVKPKTGRPHQIRIHLERISHPIIGDTRYGDSRYNYLFRDHFDSHRLLLHSLSLEFQHPFSRENIKITAPPRELSLGVFSGSDEIDWLFPSSKNKSLEN